MAKGEPRKRKTQRGHKEDPPAEIQFKEVLVTQIMSGGRVRINPQHVGRIVAWIKAFAAPWVKESNRTTRGLTGLELIREERRIKAYEHMVKGIQQLLDGLLNTVSLDEFERELLVWNVECGEKTERFVADYIEACELELKDFTVD